MSFRAVDRNGCEETHIRPSDGHLPPLLLGAPFLAEEEDVESTSMKGLFSGLRKAQIGPDGENNEDGEGRNPKNASRAAERAREAKEKLESAGRAAKEKARNIFRTVPYTLPKARKKAGFVNASGNGLWDARSGDVDGTQVVVFTINQYAKCNFITKPQQLEGWNFFKTGSQISNQNMEHLFEIQENLKSRSDEAEAVNGKACEPKTVKGRRNVKTSTPSRDIDVPFSLGRVESIEILNEQATSTKIADEIADEIAGDPSVESIETLNEQDTSAEVDTRNDYMHRDDPSRIMKKLVEMHLEKGAGADDSPLAGMTATLENGNSGSFVCSALVAIPMERYASNPSSQASKEYSMLERPLYEDVSMFNRTLTAQKYESDLSTSRLGSLDTTLQRRYKRSAIKELYDAAPLFVKERLSAVLKRTSLSGNFVPNMFESDIHKMKHYKPNATSDGFEEDDDAYVSKPTQPYRFVHVSRLGNSGAVLDSANMATVTPKGEFENRFAMRLVPLMLTMENGKPIYRMGNPIYIAKHDPTANDAQYHAVMKLVDVRKWYARYEATKKLHGKNESNKDEYQTKASLKSDAETKAMYEAEAKRIAPGDVGADKSNSFLINGKEDRPQFMRILTRASGLGNAGFAGSGYSIELMSAWSSVSNDGGLKPERYISSPGIVYGPMGNKLGGGPVLGYESGSLEHLDEQHKLAVTTLKSGWDDDGDSGTDWQNKPLRCMDLRLLFFADALGKLAQEVKAIRLDEEAGEKVSTTQEWQSNQFPQKALNSIVA